MKKLAVFSIAALTLSAIYVYAWPAANFLYAAVVLAHVGLGVAFCLGGLRLLPTVMDRSWRAARLHALVGLRIRFYRAEDQEQDHRPNHQGEA